MSRIRIDGQIINAAWLDNGEEIPICNGEFDVKPFAYGNSFSIRVAKFYIE